MLSTQIMAVYDEYDGITSSWTYRVGRTHPDALAEVKRYSGVHFGPTVVASFLRIPTQFFEAVKVEPFKEVSPFTRETPLYRG
jgi:HD-GYP domain-containing protein (c-di-GMP phosphodiesterase class II)